MGFYRSNNDSQQTWLFYAWTNPLKAFASGKVFTLSFWAKTGTLPSGVSFVRLQFGLWNPNIGTGTWRAYNLDGTYFDLDEAMSNNGQFIREITPSWKRYFVRFYINTSTTAKFVARINETGIPLIPLDTNSNVYFYIADVRFEEGYISDDSQKLSDKANSMAQIRMSAESINLEVTDKLQRTGIDIENKKITLDAENTIVTGSFAAKKVNTSDAGVGHITMENGVMQVFNSANILQITFGMDSSGNILLRYYNQDGTIAWDLGPTGIQTSASQREAVNTVNFCMMKTWNGSQWVQVPLDVDASVFDLDNYKYRDNGSTESYLRYLLRQAYLPMDGVVYFYNAKINAGQYVGGTGTCALNNEQAQCFDNHFIKAEPTTTVQLSGGVWDSTKGIGDISGAAAWRAHFIYVTHVETLLSANINDVTVINGKYYAIPNGFNPRYNSEDIFEVAYDPNEITQYYKRQLAEFTISVVEDGLYVDRYVEYYIPLDEIE